jgi:uncharacterized protein YbjT (DUF2867 family)
VWSERHLSDPGSSAAPRAEVALRLKLRIDLDDRSPSEAEVVGQCATWWQLCAGGEASVPDGIAQSSLESARPGPRRVDLEMKRRRQIGLEKRRGIGLSQQAPPSLALAAMEERTRFAVAGATGRVGRHLVDVLEAAGHEVVPIARSRGVDVISGEGLAAALEGVTCVIDAATGPSAEQDAATEFFTTAARNLQETGASAGVERIVTVSIIGCDRFSGGYGAAKLAHEGTTLAGPIESRILRAAQFHEFVAQLVDWGRRDDVSYVPRMRTQLVAARAVAGALAKLASNGASSSGSSADLIPEIAGPHEERLAEMARLLVAHRGDSVAIEEVSDAGDPDAHVFESGGLLPNPHATLAGPSFTEWLQASS